MRKVEYWIKQCFDCPFFEDLGADNVCHETTIGDRHFEYPFEADWFPEWCPLEKEDEWQPIETMPKDGTFVLTNDGVYCMVLNQPRGHSLGIWRKRNGSWYGTTESYFKPVEWRHLPPIREAQCKK